MVSTPTQPRERLRSLLDAVRARWRMQAVLRVIGRAAFAASMPVAGAAIAARALALDGGPLGILVATTFVAATAAAILVAFRSGAVAIVRRPSDVRMARFVEERVADRSALEDRAADRAAASDGSGSRQPLNDVLVSAVHEAEASHADDIGFRGLVIASAADRLAAIHPERIIPRAAIRRAAFEAIAGCAVFAIAVAFTLPPLGRAVDYAWIALFPDSVSVKVHPGDARVRPGGSVFVSATVTSRGRATETIAPVVIIESSAGRDAQTVAMSRIPGDQPWVAVIPVDGTFRYRVAAGPARSAEYTVTALLPPRAERIELDYDYPAFTKLPSRHEDDGGDIYAPSGTSVRVRIHTDKPVASGTLALTGGAAPLVAAGAAEGRVLEGRIVLSKDDSYRVALVDGEGLRSPGETEYFIRIMDDRPPDVRIVRPAGDQQITPLEEMAIEVHADDDHGIAKLELVYAVAGRDPKVVPLATRPAGEAQQAGSHVIAAEDLRVQPGDVISYYARARDVGRGKPSTETRSDMFFLEVRPFSEEFVSAQSQGMAGANADQIEGLIAAQKEIINATWSIERRAASGAGRSAADIAAIAGAQSELKTRAEQMAPNRGRAPARYPMQLQPPAGPLRQNRIGDPVSTAISAMARAVDHLQGQKPADALTHEMAALQALLQAQAEIRRREVGQASAGGGGLGRQGQDLSALFDKELQRQQRTNYETQSRVEQTPDRTDQQSALDRIRDLARRQEAMSERQRALAEAKLPEDERKRQLEKLMREQETLRQQTEDLARQLNGAQASGSRESSSDMRAAAEQMRSAASDLQRQDAAGASQRAGRAASQLRRLEAQMQGDSPDARARAAAELRMEAQQIAEAQQRIAGEAERLDKGAADADAMRRLAGEKDKLADRVDELRKSAAQLPSTGEVGQQQAAALAKDLEGQQIAPRMRETAKQMREEGTGARAGRNGAAPKRNLAEAEQQIAQALSRALDRLDAGRDGVGEISRALDQTRRMREQLDGLEQRLRQAEAKSGRAAGAQGRGASPGNQSSVQDDVKQLREEYAQAARRTREELSRLERGAPGSASGGTSPEGHEWSVTDQGTEGFKQDYSEWQSLKKNVESALERYEAATVARAARNSLQDRLSAGGSERVPDAYRKLIARYYESLARKK
jgi:hypothetical protein